jgi:type III restriction enzyme
MLPLELQVALDALYGHYERTFHEWRKARIAVPPVFIVVCNNTVNSQLLYEYIAGYEREDEHGTTDFTEGRFDLFRNYTAEGDRLQRPNTLLIDSARLESGAGIDPRFRDAFADEIELFRREKAQREGAEAARDVTDEEILREAMNTVGREGRLGEQIRCVVSVSMLTEGWDANTVTHIMGLRAFGTKLICEQVIGRGLRRLSYDLMQDPDLGIERFPVEYADIMGIDGLNFASQAVPAKPVAPRPVTHVHAVSPARDHLEIRFPRVEGYRTALPDERIEADFSGIDPFVLTEDMVGPCEVQMQGIVGMPETLTVEHLEKMRQSEIAYHLTANIIARYRDADGAPKTHLFMPMKRIVMQWLKGGHLICKGGTNPAQLLYRQIGEDVIDVILGAIRTVGGEAPRTEAILDPYNPEGSTAEVNFTTTVPDIWTTDPRRCHLNRLVLHSGWEGELCRVLDEHPAVEAYVKNHNMGFTVPYRRGGERRDYVPDFIVRLADGGADPLNLVVEVKGERRHDARLKADAMRVQWVPAVNALARFGRWDFVEVTDPYDMQAAIDRAAGTPSGLVE